MPVEVDLGLLDPGLRGPWDRAGFEVILVPAADDEADRRGARADVLGLPVGSGQLMSLRPAAGARFRPGGEVCPAALRPRFPAFPPEHDYRRERTGAVGDHRKGTAETGDTIETPYSGASPIPRVKVMRSIYSS